MNQVASLLRPCRTAAGEWLGELEIADKRGEASIGSDDADADLSISELAEYDLLLHRASPAVERFGSPVETSRLGDGHQMFGFLSRRTGLGTIRLGLHGTDDRELWQLPLRVRPVKLRDAAEFEQMVADVCAWRTALALDLRAHSSARWDLDGKVAALQPEEVLVVLRAASERHDLVGGLHHIERSGSTRLVRDDAFVRIGQDHPDPFLLGRYLHAPGDRIRVPAEHALRSRLTSLPAEAPAARRIDDVDTSPNRFAKHVATTFAERLRRALGRVDRTSELARWAAREELVLRRMTGGAFFSRVGRVGRIDLGNPTLQRRQGYRAILRAHVAMQAGLAIGWPYLSKVVFAETRDVPSLYEIWGLIMVQQTLSSTFDVGFVSRHVDMIDGRIRLVRGSFSDADRTIRLDDREIGLRLWYNRNFSPSGSTQADGFAVHDASGGTWSKSMKPDYTIALYPGALTYDDAESQGRVRLVHLDAKYKLARPGPIVPNDPQGRSHAPDDIDKMHAYAASIADSAGAFVLYPGDETSLHTLTGGRQGVGAIPAAPGRVAGLGGALRTILQRALRTEHASDF